MMYVAYLTEMLCFLKLAPKMILIQCISNMLYNQSPAMVLSIAQKHANTVVIAVLFWKFQPEAY